MELSTLSVLVLLMLDLHLVYGAPGPASGLGPRQAFLPAKAASGFLRRQKRYNTGVFEEFLEGNLERECFEERCDLEEAREVFENDDKTMAFWSGYVDGNQCKSHPCLNQGSCNDGLGSYSCSCPSGFTGRNCEIALAKRCDVNNGDCLHFCESIGTFGAQCSCANGYSLTLDGLSCEPDDEFPCGRTAITEFRQVSTRSLLRKKDTIPQNATALISITTIISPSPSEAGTTTSIPATDASTEPGLPHWMDSYDVNPTGEQPRPRKRIVGGEMIIPGEVPWQVALKIRRSGEIVCGGSILSKHWVITAAHCLLEDKDSYVVRVGEDNIYIHEDKEQDHKILEQYIHPRYNGTASLYNHDIALIYLKSAITFSTIVRPICLGPMLFIERLVKESSPATVSGWGRTRFLGLTADSLQKVKVPFVDRTECKRSSNSRITQFMFCAGYDDVAKDACQGDSGGPHANRFHDTWFLTGIVSWGEECAMDGKYGVYTRVSLYYRWITHVMGLIQHQLEFDVENPDSQR